MKLINALFAFSVGLFIFGCNNPPKPSPPSQAEQILKGEHKLRKMVERTDINTNFSSTFFLIVGETNSETKTSVSVKFAWEMNDSIYAISSLPIEKIRVKLDNEADTPTIRFQWKRLYNCDIAIQDLMNDYVVYALLTVKERDWPVQVNLPLNR